MIGNEQPVVGAFLKATDSNKAIPIGDRIRTAYGEKMGDWAAIAYASTPIEDLLLQLLALPTSLWTQRRFFELDEGGDLYT